MTRTLSCLFLAASLAAFPLCAQTVLLSETFDDGVPADWSQQTLATDGGWLAGTSAQLESQWWAIAPHGQIVANDDGCDCDKSEDYLILPELDFSGVDNAMLAFSTYFDGGTYQGTTEGAFIEYSLDGGETFVLMQALIGSDDGAWDFEVINLEDVIGEPSVHLAFRYNDGGG